MNLGLGQGVRKLKKDSWICESDTVLLSLMNQISDRENSAFTRINGQLVQLVEIQCKLDKFPEMTVSRWTVG